MYKVIISACLMGVLFIVVTIVCMLVELTAMIQLCLFVLINVYIYISIRYITSSLDKKLIKEKKKWTVKNGRIISVC